MADDHGFVRVAMVLLMLGALLSRAAPAQELDTMLAEGPTLDEAATIVPVEGGVIPPPNQAEDEKVALAKKLSNPVASLVSVPFQLNFDQDLGPDESGERWLLNVQPVIPFELNDEWNLISRTIVPIIRLDDVAGDSTTGMGDITQSLFFSPKAPTADGWIWGVGPAFLIPTGNPEQLTADKWGAGPTAVVLKQEGHWTYGALANHIWSFAGNHDRADVNSTYLQPFLAYTTPEAITYSLNSESTYDWEDDEWSAPINLFATKVTKIGDQLVSYGGGLRYWVESPDGGPEGLGVRFIFTLLFPK